MSFHFKLKRLFSFQGVFQLDWYVVLRIGIILLIGLAVWGWYTSNLIIRLPRMSIRDLPSEHGQHAEKVSFITDDGIQLSIRKRSFIDCQIRPKILGIDNVLLGMYSLLPGVIIAEFFFVLTLKITTIHTQIGLQALAANGISVD